MLLKTLRQLKQKPNDSYRISKTKANIVEIKLQRPSGLKNSSGRPKAMEQVLSLSRIRKFLLAKR